MASVSEDLVVEEDFDETAPKRRRVQRASDLGSKDESVSKSSPRGPPKPKIKSSSSSGAPVPTSPLKSKALKAGETVSLAMGSHFVEDHLSTFSNILILFDGSVRRELISDAYEAAGKRQKFRAQGHQPRIIKRLKEEHLSLIIKYRMHTRYGAPLVIALSLIIGCNPHLVNTQWASGVFELVSPIQSLPIDEDTTREEQIRLFESLHHTLRALPDSVVRFLGPSLRKLHADVHTHPSTKELYQDMLQLHLMLRSNPIGVSAVDLDHLYRLLSSPYLHFTSDKDDDEGNPIIQSPKISQALADTFRKLPTELLIKDALASHAVDATLDDLKAKWERELQSAKSIFAESAANADGMSLVNDSVNSSINGHADDDELLETHLEQLDAYLGEPLSDPENEDPQEDADQNHSAYLNWLLNGELKFTRLEDAFRVHMIWDSDALRSSTSEQFAHVDADDLEDRVYTWKDTPLWIVKDIPIPQFLVPYLVGAKEMEEQHSPLATQSPPLLKRYVSRHGKPFLWSPDISKGSVAPRAVPCLNDVDMEQPQDIQEWIYKSKPLTLDPFLENYETNKLEPRQFCTDCGADCGNHTDTQRGEDRKFVCKCASTNSSAGYAYTNERRLRPDWPDAWTIYECGDACGCDPHKCGNRVVQHGAQHSFLIFKTRMRGWGVRSLRNIKKGEFLLEYCGEMLPNYESDERERLYDMSRRTFMFTLQTPNMETSKRRCYEIDAAQIGNESRFFNHRCEPNCFVYNVCVNEKIGSIKHRLAFFALRDVVEGEEVTIDYRMQASGENANKDAIPCFCGAPKCRKTMF